MIAYRFYRIAGNRLVAPFAGIPLPDNGIDVAACCTRLICEDGLSAYDSLEAMRCAAQIFDLPNEDHVIVRGEVGGPVRPDNRRQIYTNLIGTAFSAPTPIRCNSFRAVAILATRATTLVYPVPVIIGTPEDLVPE